MEIAGIGKRISEIINQLGKIYETESSKEKEVKKQSWKTKGIIEQSHP